MKKILCILLCVVTLLPCFAVFAWAAEEEKDIVLEEMKNFTINGKAFDVADYPIDASKTVPDLLTIREVGVDPDRPATEWIADYELYFYFYDPAASFDHWEGSVYITFDESKPQTITEDMRRYFSDVKVSQCGRFIRAKLEPMGLYSGAFNNLQDRVYHIHRYSLAYTYFDDYIFHVSGSNKSNDLKYFDGGYLTMDLELHGSVWRYEDPIAADNLNTYNEIATVYFTVPRSVYEQYDHIQQITADFKQFLSSPIVVTTSPTVNDMDIGPLMSGFDTTDYTYLNNVPTIQYGKYEYYQGDSISPTTTPVWIYNPTDSYRDMLARYKKRFKIEGYSDFTFIEDALSFYFYETNVEVDANNNFFQVVDSSSFEEYIDAYMAAYYPNHSFESGVAPELYESCDTNFNVTYNYGESYEFGNFRPDTEINCWEWLCMQFGHVYGEDYTEKVSKFSVIENPAFAVEYYQDDLVALSNDLKIGRNDAADFLEYLKTADGYVVLLRFAAGQYECYEATISNGDQEITDGQSWVVRMPYYRDIDVTTVTFRRGAYDFTYTVEADPLDHLDGGISVKDEWKDRITVSIDGGTGWWQDFLDFFNETVNYMMLILLLIGFALIVYAVSPLLGMIRGSNKVKVVVSNEQERMKKPKKIKHKKKRTTSRKK